MAVAALAACACFVIARRFEREVSDTGAVKATAWAPSETLDSTDAPRVRERLAGSIERESNLTPPPSTAEPRAESVARHVRERVGDDPETQTIEEGRLVDGKREGRWRTLRPGGEIWSESEYKNGVLDGPSVVWSGSGWKESDTEYKGGRMDGRLVAWHPNGQKACEYLWEKGVREGAWREWRADGSLSAEGHSSANEYDGRCVFYRADGTADPVHSGLYAHGKKVAELP